MYFLNINKPKGISSFDVVRTLRKQLNVKQIGHSGTLDPLAFGVMQVAVGSATKLLDYLNSDKEYIATLNFGYISSTYDDEGEKTFVKEPDFSKEELLNVLDSFLGKTLQKPPVYSAIKVNGKKLCDIVRKNPQAKIDVLPREIEIYSIDLLEFSEDFAKIKVFCKKGTYIRSLVHDIGQKLSCGAYVTELIRTKAGCFELKESDDLIKDKYNEINPLDVLELDKKALSEKEYSIIQNGNFIKTDRKYDSEMILLEKDNKLVSVARISDGFIKPKKNFKDK